jgi:hypothetical protein
VVAGLDLNPSVGVEDDVDPRPKFDEPDALPAGDRVSHFEIKHNTPGDEARDLLENYGASFAFHGNDILLVFVGRVWGHGIQKFSALIAHLSNNARDWRTIHVDVEDVEKDADAGALDGTGVDDGNVGDFAVAGRDDGTGLVRDLALGIAEKPEAESSEEKHGDGVGPGRQPGDYARRDCAADTVEVAVTHHEKLR